MLILWKFYPCQEKGREVDRPPPQENQRWKIKGFLWVCLFFVGTFFSIDFAGPPIDRATNPPMVVPKGFIALYGQQIFYDYRAFLGFK